VSTPVVLQDNFSRGIVADVAREDIPRGAVWDMVDLIPDLGAPLRGRGSWKYASPAGGSGSLVLAVGWGDFISGQHLVKLTDGGTLFGVSADGTTQTVRGSMNLVAQQPFMHRNKLIFPCPGHNPVYYDGDNPVADLGGGAPQAYYGCAYKDYTVLARDATHPTRLWFSDPGNPQHWDTTNSWLDGTYAVTGIVAMKNAILIFSLGHVEKITGSIPPPGTDMSKGPFLAIGTPDARSIVNYGDFVVWANQTGVWMTDGAVAQDLTKAAGVKQRWLALTNSIGTLGVTGGIIRDHYVVTLWDSATLKDTWLIDLTKKTMWRASNISALMYATGTGGRERVYFADRESTRVGEITDLFFPAVGDYADADGVTIQPNVELPYYRPTKGLKRWKNIYVDADVRDPAATNPVLGVAYVTSPESGAYTPLTSVTFGETATDTRRRIPIRVRSAGIGLALAQVNGAGGTRIYSVEADVLAEEGSKIGV